MAILGYSTLILIQKVKTFEVLSNLYLKWPTFANMKQLTLFYLRQSSFTWFIKNWGDDPFLPSLEGTIQIFEWLYIRKTELIILYWYMICINGEAAITGWFLGFATQVKEITPECSVYTVIHREMLVNCEISPKLNNICMMWLELLNHSKVHTFNSCLFMQLFT